MGAVAVGATIYFGSEDHVARLKKFLRLLNVRTSWACDSAVGLFA